MEVGGQASSMPGCPQDAALVELASGTLAVAEAAALREHLERCDNCRLAIAAVLREGRPRDTQARLGALAPGTVVAARYRVIRPIGSGGMGEVHEAWDLNLERRVALKTLLPRGDDLIDVERRMARLVRESKAMARLRHPNVVTVFDAGRWGAQAYVVMELVEGETLRSWEARPHTHEEIVAMFLQAARGLQAAHEQNVIHRDFKPDNVLIDKHGRLQVTDFGLARIVHDGGNVDPLDSASRDQPVRAVTSTVNVSGSLTETGTAVGTPAYMAPEQFRSQDAGIAADVFAFCAALHEALAGQRPFVGDSPRDIQRAQREGASELALQRAGVSAWLRAAILAGLQYDPSLRPCDVASLIRTLESPKRRHARRWLAAGAGIAIVGAVGVFGSRTQPELCAVGDPLQGVWDERVRAGITQSVDSKSRDWVRVENAFDKWAENWSAAWSESCVARDAVRQACLAGLRQRVGGLTHGMAAGSIASDAAERVLPTVSSCAVDRELALASPEPDEPQLRAQVRSVREAIAELETRIEAGDLGDLVGEAEAIEGRARNLGFGPLHAETLFVVGVAQSAAGQPQLARATHLAAAQRAGASGHDVLASQAWLALVDLEAQDPSDPPRGLEYGANAMAAADRVGTGALAREIRSRAHYTLGVFAQADLRPGDALREFTAAKEAPIDSDPRFQLSVLEAIAVAQADSGQYEDALVTHLALADRYAQELGGEDPALVLSWTNIGIASAGLGRSSDALVAFQRATHTARESLGVHHPDYGMALHNEAELLQSTGHYGEALGKFVEAESIAIEAFGADHFRVGAAVEHRAGTLQALGRYEEALPLMRRALAIYERRGRRGDAATCRANLADLLRESGRPQEALVEADAAVLELADLAEFRVPYGYALAVYGEILVELGRDHEAIDPLERAIAQLHAAGNLTLSAVAEFALARALARVGGDRARTLALADAAEAVWAAEPLAWTLRRQQLQSWRAALENGRAY